MSDYSKGKLYKITNNYNDDVYVGSTCDRLVKRFSKHKCDARYEKNQDRPLYVLINEIGFERFRIQLIEEYVCEDKYQLRQREGHFIREIGTLNKKIAGRDMKQWRKENPEYNKQYNKEYRENNTEQIKEYRENNKDNAKETFKKYYENNKKRISEQHKEKTICECGCEIIKMHLSRHIKTKKHLNLMNSITTETE